MSLPFDWLERKPFIIMTLGLPASGKTTWAKDHAIKTGAVRINKDDIRAMFAVPWSKKLERLVVEARNQLIDACLKEGKDVIIDDTNLNTAHFRAIYNRFHLRADILIKTFIVDVDECIRRDSLRPNSVGKDVILSMNDMLPNALNYKIPESYEVTRYVINDTKPPAYICDLDGTLAIHQGRSPYDYAKLGEDLPNPALVPIINALIGNNANIIFLSGRPDTFRDQTEEWLLKNFQFGIRFPMLYMRKEGDGRKDSQIKSEIFDTSIANHFNVLGIFDDRNIVVEMWRRKGLYVFDVNQTKEWF